MHSARLKHLSSWTAVKVVDRIVGKSFIAKNSSLTGLLRFAQCISHVCHDPALLTGHVVFVRTVLVISHHGLHLAVCILLVLID